MAYRRTVQIEFNHCDPAGIVFYPRYFEMTNSVVENFFAEVLAYPFARIHLTEGCGVPTARIATEFKRPSRLGDQLTFALEVLKFGRSSADLQIVGQVGDELRLTVTSTLVWVGQDGRPQSWPEDIRQKMTAFMKGSPDDLAA